MVLPFVAVSVAAPAAISTVTAPFEVGVIDAVYEAPLPEKLVIVPFTIVRSPETNPVTDSLKVIVIGMGEVFVELAAELVIVTVGTVVSTIRFLPPARDEPLASPGRVSVALLFEASLIVPELSASDDVAT